MDGWIDDWVGEWMGGWMVALMDEWLDVCMDEWLARWMDGCWIDWWLDGCMYEYPLFTFFFLLFPQMSGNKWGLVSFFNIIFIFDNSFVGVKTQTSSCFLYKVFFFLPMITLRRQLDTYRRTPDLLPVDSAGFGLDSFTFLLVLFIPVTVISSRISSSSTQLGWISSIFTQIKDSLVFWSEPLCVCELSVVPP